MEQLSEIDLLQTLKDVESSHRTSAKHDVRGSNPYLSGIGSIPAEISFPLLYRPVRRIDDGFKEVGSL